MFQKLIWSEDYITGNKELDDYHKNIFELTNELLLMFKDTNRYMNQIPEKTRDFSSALLEHLEVEGNLLKKYDIPDFQKHLDDHERFKQQINTINNYEIPIILKAITIGSIICDYFLEHFPIYDKLQIPVLNKKISEEQKNLK